MTSKPASKTRESPPDPPGDYASSGVDRTLIRWMLGLSPLERLRVVQQQINAIHEFREKLNSD